MQNGRLLLLSPLRYWAIQHPVKRRWDLYLPALGSLALTATLLFWPSVPSPYGAGGFLSSLQNLFAILGGFFVSALTLVATSPTAALLKPLAGNPKVKLAGESVPLTRQRFLCLLFGYLAFSSFSLYALGFVASMMAPGLKQIVAEPLRPWISGIFLIPYNFWLTHLFVSTMVGLYYFTDRLARTDPEIIRGPRD